MSEEDLELLITLDDPWNAQECDTFYNQEAEDWLTPTARRARQGFESRRSKAVRVAAMPAATTPLVRIQEA